MARISPLRIFFNKNIHRASCAFHTFRARVMDLGWEQEEALITPAREYLEKNIIYQGKAYSMKEIYDNFCSVEIPYMTFRNRILLHGFSIEDACSVELNQHRKHDSE